MPAEQETQGPRVVRAAEEISEARYRAQKVAFAADDTGESDDVAETCYQLLQWVLGDSDTDPTTELAEGGDEAEDDPDDV